MRLLGFAHTKSYYGELGIYACMPVRTSLRVKEIVSFVERFAQNEDSPKKTTPDLQRVKVEYSSILLSIVKNKDEGH